MSIRIIETTAPAHPTKEAPEVLVCPYCGSEVLHWLTPPEQKGRKQVQYETVTHQVPACPLQEALKKKHIDVYLETARAVATRVAAGRATALASEPSENGSAP
jgi:hypothetical protein